MALLADHELAASTFAARMAASVRADPYAVVATGLGALGGALHASPRPTAEPRWPPRPCSPRPASPPSRPGRR